MNKRDVQSVISLPLRADKVKSSFSIETSAVPYVETASDGFLSSFLVLRGGAGNPACDG